MTNASTDPVTAIFAVLYRYRDDTSLQDTHRSGHIAYLSKCVDSGELLVSGPWAPGQTPGGLLFYRVKDRAALETILGNDTFVAEGVTTHVEIHDWQPLVGPLAGGFGDQP